MATEASFTATTTAQKATSEYYTRISIQNLGTVNVYIGVTANVTATTGHKLEPGEVWTDQGYPPAAPYVLAASGTAALSVITI